MNTQFLDRVLRCADCDADFIFTAGEQLFFFDKQFKNDPKRCKPCKCRRSGLAAAASGLSLPAGKMLRTETRTECSACGIETTVPFKPTQGRPVLCRQCFGSKSPVPPAIGPGVTAEIAAQASVLAELSATPGGPVLSRDAAVLAVTSMAAAAADSSVASEQEMAYASMLAAGTERAGTGTSSTGTALPHCTESAPPETLSARDLAAGGCGARLQN